MSFDCDLVTGSNVCPNLGGRCYGKGRENKGQSGLQAHCYLNFSFSLLATHDITLAQ